MLPMTQIIPPTPCSSFLSASYLSVCPSAVPCPCLLCPLGRACTMKTTRMKVRYTTSSGKATIVLFSSSKQANKQTNKQAQGNYAEH